MSSSCSDPSVFELSDRHPNMLKVLDEIFHMSINDFDVLVLCELDYSRFKYGLSELQCRESPTRFMSMLFLTSKGMIHYNHTNKVYQLTGCGNAILRAVYEYLDDYTPRKPGKVQLIEFPASGQIKSSA